MMSKFKPGDIVKLIDVSRYGYTEKMKQLSGQLLTVRSTLDDEFYPTVFAGIPGSIDYYPWHANDLELMIEAQLEQKTDTYLNQQNEVWDAVAKTLDEVSPGWLLNCETKEEAAVEAIRNLALKANKSEIVQQNNTPFFNLFGNLNASLKEPPKKPLCWGDLVVHAGEIHMIFDDHPDEDTEYRILCLTKDYRYSYISTKELTKIGSISKKLKKLKTQLEYITSAKNV
jgi:hypothetical protein